MPGKAIGTAYRPYTVNSECGSRSHQLSPSGESGVGELGFGKVGRWGGKLCRSTTSKSAWVKVYISI